MEVRVVKSEQELKEASEVLARAFFNYPAIRFIFPHVEQRKKLLPIFYRGLVKYGFKYGKMLIVIDEGQILGTATFVKSRWAEQTIFRMASSGLLGLIFRMPLSVTYRSLRFSTVYDGMIQRFCKKDSLYLTYVGVHPEHQGKKICSQLLENIVNESSESFLETNDPQNIPMYEKFGFRVVAKKTVAPGAPECHFMLRETSL